LERTQRIDVAEGFPTPTPDLKVTIHPAVAEPLFREDWTAARELCVKLSQELLAEGYQRDGLSVKAGPSWFVPFESSPTMREE
jgi:hypothetical protein